MGYNDSRYGYKYPCRECSRRHQNCHSECEEYKAAREKNDEVKKIIEKDRVGYTLGKKQFGDQLRRIKNENHWR